ncbi:hypothetical protein [Nocardia testacea]|uniref:hypothetical protein n=1 Tax=Nocardia testacea TaxID=248551 RepID=UPI00031D0293|nr:hypothetical protein [Nocardia testacea]
MGAVLPARTAVPALTVGYLFGSGVITIAALDRLQQGETGLGLLDFAIAGIYPAVAFLLITRSARTHAGPRLNRFVRGRSCA